MRIGIRLAISGLVLSSIVVSAVGVHLLWWRTAEANSHALADTINQQIVAAVEKELTVITTEAAAAHTAIRTLFVQNVLGTREADKREFVFLAQLQAQPGISWVAFGWPDGEFFAAHKLGDLGLEMMEIAPVDGVIKRRVDNIRWWSAISSSRSADSNDTDYNVHRSGMVPERHPEPTSRLVRSHHTSGRHATVDRLCRPDRRLPEAPGRARGHYRKHAARPIPVAAFGWEDRRCVHPGTRWHRHRRARSGRRRSQHAAVGSAVAADRARRGQGRPGSLLRQRSKNCAPDAVSSRRRRLCGHFDAADFPGWTLATVIPEAEFLGPIETTIRHLLIGLAILIAAAGMLSAWLARRFIAKPLITVVDELKHVERFELEQVRRHPSHLVELANLSDAIADMAGGLAAFRKYIPADLVRTLVSEGIEPKPGGAMRTLTVLFADIAGFTGLSERLGDRIVPLLSSYLDTMSREVSAHGGTIDKFIGDAVMAFWGAPATNARSCRRRLPGGARVPACVARIRH